MKCDYVVGVDVAGEKRGFHGAVLGLGDRLIRDLFNKKKPKDVVNFIRREPGNCRLIAVDSPPRAHVNSEKTRLAERELNSDGYNVQWTPRDEEYTSPGKWMENGEKLWNQLKIEFTEDMIIETFPTASSDGLSLTSVSLPLRLLDDSGLRKDVKDYFDASVCAVVAREFHTNKNAIKTYGDEPGDRHDDEETDELGPIHVLRPNDE